MVSKAALSKPAVLGDFVQRGPRLKRRQRRPKSPLTIEQILAWADAHHERTGKWPTLRSGAITDAPGENWVAVNYALKKGRRGLLKNSSLAWLLIRQRGVKKTCAAPRLTIKQILAWADAHHQRTGQWPNQQSGPIAGSQGDTWCAVNRALAGGWRGLRGGSSLTRLLARKHSLRNSRDLPSLSVAQILAWADAHYKRTGKWPTLGSGLIAGSRGDTWSAVSDALRNGSRGLPKGSSLARLLARRRGARKARSLPVLSVANILAWADAHHRRTGKWPQKLSGPIAATRGETWYAIDAALRSGSRGLSGRSSLAGLLEQNRGVRTTRNRSPLTIAQILAWANAYRAKKGHWPSWSSGPVDGTTWSAINAALMSGGRGLPAGSSLAKLLQEQKPH